MTSSWTVEGDLPRPAAIALQLSLRSSPLSIESLSAFVSLAYDLVRPFLCLVVAFRLPLGIRGHPNPRDDARAGLSGPQVSGSTTQPYVYR